MCCGGCGRKVRWSRIKIFAASQCVSRIACQPRFQITCTQPLSPTTSHWPRQRIATKVAVASRSNPLYQSLRCSYGSTPKLVHHPFRILGLFERPATMSMSNSESFIEPPMSSSEADEIDSLPSSTTASSADEEEYISDAEREWRESLQQLELLLTMVMVPYVGKYFGRKCAYWGTS